MSIILCIETTTTNCSVAVFDHVNLLASKEDQSSQYNHAEQLHQYTEDILRKTNIPIQKLDAVAVSQGPGSYTGLRIGLAAAKGICYAIKKPLIGLCSLAILAQQIQGHNGIIITAIDARRMEVYDAIFNETHQKIQDAKPHIISSDAYHTYANQEIIMIGNAIEKCQETITLKNISYKSALPSSINMGILATQRYEDNAFEDIAYFEPQYLKPFSIN